MNRNELDWICYSCTDELFPFNHFVDDCDFLCSLLNQDQQFALRSHYDDMCFNPFDTPDLHDGLSLQDVDPDLNFFNDDLLLSNFNCSSYHTEDSFINECKSKCKSNYFSIFHNNVRSLLKHEQDLKTLLDSLQHKFHIIGLTETWLNANNVDLVNIDGYSHEYVHRTDRIGGGVSLYIDKTVDYKRMHDQEVINDNIETVVVEIDQNSTDINKTIQIVAVYRPPGSDIRCFNQTIEGILTSLKAKNGLCYVLGDFNINLLNSDTHALSAEFLNIMYSSGLYPVISKPTRITASSATLMDNFFCNFGDTGQLFNGILLSDISDHLSIFSIASCVVNTTGSNIIKKRFFSERNVNKFINELENTNWSVVREQNDCQDAFTLFYSKFKEIYDSCFPCKCIKVDHYKNRKPWLTSGLKNAIKKKNQLYILMLKKPSLTNSQIYKQYRNSLHRLLKKAEKNHYSTLIEQNKGNLCKMWKLLKQVINKNKVSNCNNSFIINNQSVKDEGLVAEAFNKYFVNVGTQLSKNIPQVNISPFSHIDKK